MNRAVLLLPLLLAGCQRNEAVQAVIQLDPMLAASCVVLEVLNAEEKIGGSEFLTRSDPKDTEVKVAVYRGDLPADVQLQARAFWGKDCEEPRFYNGRSEPVDVRFKPGKQTVTLKLSPPSAAEDEDRDGFVASELGGADCDDKRNARRPGVQELCDASDDLNCDGRRGCDDATCSALQSSQPPTSLVFNLSELTTTAGQCSQTVTVERRDANGTPAKIGCATPIALTSTFASGVTLHTDPSCSSSAPAAIPVNGSNVTFYVRSTPVGTGSLNATASTLGPATLPHILRPGPATKVVFTSPSTTSQAGDCAPVSLEWRDEFGNPTSGTLFSLSLNPAPSSTTEAALYQDAGCTTTLSLNAQPATSLSAYFKATRATTFNLVARLNATAVQEQETRTVNPLAASKLSLSPSAGQTLGAGQCSAPVNLRVTDKYDNLSPLPASQLLSLSTTPQTSFEVYRGAECVSSQKLAKDFEFGGTAEGLLSFKIKTGGPVELKLSGASMEEVKQSHTIIPAVRRGSCKLDIGQKEKKCPINSPLPVNLSRSFLVFQTTSSNNKPKNSFVRCSLAPTTIDCTRDDLAPTGDAGIEWQVVELYQGLSVQHLPSVSCTQPNLPIPLPTAVDMSSTFVLVSSSQEGDTVDNNDFTSFQLTSPTELSAVTNGGCNPSNTFSVQVVQFPGSQVQRDVTGEMNSALLTVPTTSSADPTRSIVLSTWQVSTSDQHIHKRLIRGEIDPVDSTRLLFHRGAGTALTTSDIPQISWERITFPTGTLVQTLELKVESNESGTNASLDTTVDATRTLLLTSSQAGGQGAGETSFETDDILGVATGRLSLANGNQLSVVRGGIAGVTKWTAYAIQFDP